MWHIIGKRDLLILLKNFLLFFLSSPRICSLILESEEGERERETSIGCLSHDKGINLRPFGLQDNMPTNWATPGRARTFYFLKSILIWFILQFILVTPVFPFHIQSGWTWAGDVCGRPRSIIQASWLQNYLVPLPPSKTVDSHYSRWLRSVKSLWTLTHYSRGNTELGSCEPLATEFSSTDRYIAMFLFKEALFNV